MDKFLKDLQKAYKKIPKKYFNQDVIHSLDGQYAVTQDIERVVLAELYHQWRTKMQKVKIKYKDLILHSEIGKRLVRNKEIKHPDLVLHGGQTGAKRLTHNKIFVELKMNEFDEGDISKCFHALQNHNYLFSVCIIHDSTTEDILKSIKTKISLFRGNNMYYDKLYFLSSHFKLTTLATFMKDV